MNRSTPIVTIALRMEAVSPRASGDSGPARAKACQPRLSELPRNHRSARSAPIPASAHARKYRLWTVRSHSPLNSGPAYRLIAGAKLFAPTPRMG